MYDARTKLSDQVANEVREHFADQVCRIVIPRTVRLSEAPSFGQPITVFDPASRGADRLPGTSQGGQQWRAVAGWVRASAPSSPPRSTGDRTRRSARSPSATSGRTPASPGVNFDEESMAVAGRLDQGARRAPAGPGPPLGGESSDEFELIAGERRWRAARRAGLHTIPVLVQTSDDTHSLEQALVENLHRQDLNVLEEAAAYQQLIEEFGFTHEQVATRVGKSRTAVTNTLRLLQLPAGVQRLLAEGQISPGHARALLGTPDRGYQEVLARAARRRGA